MTGYKYFYIIRMGKYRIGIKKSGKVVEIHPVTKQETIYKIFHR